MKCSPRLVTQGAILLAAAGCVAALKGELPSWAQETIAFTPLEGALFRIMGLPDGTVMHLRPAWESRSHLGGMIEKTPRNAELYSLRAREEERLADYPAAEADWKQAAGASQDKLASLEALADFYHRRVAPEQEVSTLLQLASTPEEGDERFEPAAQQPQWTAFTRAIDVSNESRLPATRYEQVYNAWIHRYPKEIAPYQAYLDWAIDRRDRQMAAAGAAQLKAAFPNDAQVAITTDANLARIQRGADAALAVYSKNFSPLWPQDLRTKYFQELSAAHQLRAFLGEAQAAATADPASLNPALRLFFYYEQQGRKDIADQKLLNLVSIRAPRNVSWTPDDLKTVSALLLRVADYDEAARLDYSLYELPSATRADKEQALSAIISMLLDVPEQPLNFGNRDLSLYKNIAGMDRHPGLVNGILSLVLNNTNPDFQYQNASQTAVAYFHRASASRLIDRLRQQFPGAPQTPELEAKLFYAYATYGQEDAIIRLVPAWLNHNRNASDYVYTALLLADAYQWKQDTQAELAIYDRVLTELADKSGRMPIGPGGVISDAAQAPAANNSRSPDYSRVLDRYISRLVQLNRSMQALALFRREIDHNPNDPGIYERFALFLEQNRLDSDLEQTYRDALNHFKDMSWASKLGRFYLRQREYDAYAQLAHRITDTFTGSELAAFLSNAGTSSPVLFRQVNLYAHKRFPYNLVFVKNLLAAYRAKPTRDEAAYEDLLRENWFNDTELQNNYFEYLSSSGKLRSQLASLPDLERSVKDSNLAALEFRADGEAWLTNYEAAAPVFVRLASLTPGDPASTGRGIAIERSLAATQPGAFDSAIRLAQQDVNSDPGNRNAITRVGEIYADREMYSQARPWWNRVAAVRPGDTAGYLDSATVFWDYFQFNDALRIISECRRSLGKPALFGYEAGAIYENQGHEKQAIDSYISAALREGSEEAKARLLILARRKPTRALVEEQTARLTSGAFDSTAFQLRLALLEKLDRRSDIQAMLSSLLPRTNKLSGVEEIASAAARLGFDEIAADCLHRIVAMTADPIEKIQARMELARFYETHNNTAAAEHEFSSLLQAEPNRLGVIRAAVDFYWRQKQSQAAVTTLEAASDRAQPPYQDQLRREAAEKAANSGQYQEARRLLEQLLAKDPYNGDLLAEAASTYARQNDTPGLVSFYATKLNAFQAAPLPAQEKTARIAGLRRGYAMALTTAGQFRDALEQYQLLLNAFPEDGLLASEIARYADARQLALPLIAYYQKATSESPRDYRWPLVLARIETSLRHYPQAITAYEKAAYVRPDRSDLFIAKADLETRLLRFDDAIKSYAKLYELSFHNVEYLADQAELYARLGNHPQTMRLLRAAYIDPRPHEPAGYVSAMEHLAEWHMYSEENTLFEDLRPLLSPNSPSKLNALTLEVEALIALHRPSNAFALISALAQKNETADLARTTGQSIAVYLEPQERAALNSQIESSNPLPKGNDLYDFAEAAGLRDIQAEALVRQSENGIQVWQSLDQLQSSRLLFETLGNQLESIASTQRDAVREAILSAAFAAYKKAEETAAELRLSDYAGGDFPRLFTLAGGDLNQRLATLAEHSPKRANEVIQYMIMNAPPDAAVAAISTRGRRLTPLWTHSYTALTALYTLSPSAWGTRSFDQVLGPRSVGGELASLSSNDFLREANWFYYAARYGDYLGYRKLPSAQDYLPASLEAKPAASNSYVELADSLADLNQPAHSAQLYRQALQLSPDRADVYERLALLALTGNRRAEAIADWRRAFEILAARVEKGPLPPDYWPTAQDILAHVNRAHAIDELKPAADTMLRAYARRNGAYQFEPFLAGIFDHPPDRRAALAWVMELARIPGMEQLLSDVLDSSGWIDPAEKDPLYRAEIERARKTGDAAAGQAAVEARAETKRQINRHAQYLSEQKRWPEAWAILQQIQPASEIPPVLLLTAGALTGHLDDLLSGFRAQPDTAPAGEQVLAAAATLHEDGHADLAVRLKEYEYGRELAGSAPPASAWFGMASVRFDQKRNDEALSLIRSVTLSVGTLFENLPETVHLLEERELKGEAARYAQEWKTAEPWDDHAQLAFARLKADSKLLDKVRRAPSAPYEVRVQAARSMRGLSAAVTGTDELSLLTHTLISPAEASQPFYMEARLDAARQSSDPASQTKLFKEAIALDPTLREPRLQLAEAAFTSSQDTLGLAAFESYRAASEPSSPGGETDANYTSVEKLAADAEMRRRNWSLALEFYDDLLKRVKDPLLRVALIKARDAAAEKQNLDIANESRRPLVTNDVAQPGIVKPKLTSLPANLVIAKEPESGGPQ
ncbi:MAG: hypothetical protein WB992_12985 [Bryobacteraceae bacterium]